MTDILAAMIVAAEASVLNYPGKVAVAQCIQDVGFDPSVFTEPFDSFSKEEMSAVKNVFHGTARRFTNASIRQFRSFAKYSDGDCHPDWRKLYSGICPIPSDLMYLGEDHVNKEWGHFYFGRYKTLKPFKLLLIAGHGRNQNGSWDPGAIGCGYQEANLTRELVGLIKPICDANNLPCDVITDTNMYSYFKVGKEFDFRPYNYVLEIHFNASPTKTETPDGEMKGSMCFIDQSETGHSVEDKILQGLYDIGSKQAWDGATITQKNYPTGLMVQNHVRSQGVSHAVLETCFITDGDDMEWYQALKNEIASRIVQGIVDGFGLNAGFPNTTWCGKGIATGEAIMDMNVRMGPSVNAKWIGVVNEGEKVEVLEMLENGWLKIVWPGDPDGYAYTSNVQEAYYKYV